MERLTDERLAEFCSRPPACPCPGCTERLAAFTELRQARAEIAQLKGALAAARQPIRYWDSSSVPIFMGDTPIVTQPPDLQQPDPAPVQTDNTGAEQAPEESQQE